MTNKAGRSGSRPAKSKFKGFINVEFNAEDRDHFRRWSADREPDMVSSMVEKSEMGWKSSFAFDAWNDAYTFAITGKKTGTKYDGYCLVVRHRDVDRLMELADYLCHFIVVDETYPTEEEADNLDWV